MKIRELEIRGFIFKVVRPLLLVNLGVLLRAGMIRPRVLEMTLVVVWIKVTFVLFAVVIPFLDITLILGLAEFLVLLDLELALLLLFVAVLFLVILFVFVVPVRVILVVVIGVALVPALEISLLTGVVEVVGIVVRDLVWAEGPKFLEMGTLALDLALRLALIFDGVGVFLFRVVSLEVGLLLVCGQVDLALVERDAFEVGGFSKYIEVILARVVGGLSEALEWLAESMELGPVFLG